MKQFLKVVNLGWLAGLFYFHAILTVALIVLKKGRTLLQSRTLMLAFALFIFAALAGAYFAFAVLARKTDDRRDSALFSALFTLYPLSFLGAYMAVSPLQYLAFAFLCCAVIGYNAAFLNTLIAAAVHLDRAAGKTIGTAVLICCALLTATCALKMHLFSFLIGFFLLLYLLCRPPKRYFSARYRVVRKELNIVSTPRALGNYQSMVAVLGLRCAAFICLVLPVYNTDAISESFGAMAVFCGLGALAAGLLRDRLTHYLPALPFLAGCLSLITDSFFGVPAISRVGIALRWFMSGAVFLYFLTAVTDFPFEQRFSKALKNGLCTLLAALIVGIACFSFAVLLPNGRASVKAAGTMSMAAILVLLFFDSIYQKHEPPRQSFEVSAAIFCQEHKLTARESEVVTLVLTSNKSLKEIAAELYISPSTLEKHMTNIYEKTKTRNRAELTHLFLTMSARTPGA